MLIFFNNSNAASNSNYNLFKMRGQNVQMVHQDLITFNKDLKVVRISLSFILREESKFILGNTEEQFLMNAVEKTKTQQGSSLNRASAFEFDGVFSKDKIKITISTIGIQSISIIVMVLVFSSFIILGFQGYKSDQVIYQSNVLYFRGELIIRSIFDHFITKFQKAEIVILSGCSVGGLQPCNGNKKISILCVADSSILYDMQSMNGFNLLQQSLKIMNYIANNETQVPQKNCASDFPNQIWKCFYFQNLMHYIQQPVFIIQPFYDISFLYKLNTKQLLENEMDFIDHVFQTFRQVIKESLTNNSNTGSFAPSCIADCLFISQLSFSPNWTIPESSNRTVYQTLVKWVENQKYNSYCQIDFGLMDQQPWPKNSGCAEISSSINLIKLINMILWIIIILL